MVQKRTLPMGTLLLLISFASVNAVLPTPGLHQIAVFFQQSEQSVQILMTGFLWGYAFGQLLYGPLANYFGRKPAIYIGLFLQLLSCLLCIASGKLYQFNLLVLARFLMALGSGVGLKMTFTLVNEYCDGKTAAAKTAWLVLGFAFIPGIMVSISGLLIAQFSWFAAFYLAFAYGMLLLLMAWKLPETLPTHVKNALQWKNILKNYGKTLCNPGLISGAVTMGSATCFIYLYATLSPLISIGMYGMNSASYGLFNLIPTIGLVIGCLLSAKMGPKIGMVASLIWGCLQSAVAISMMGIALYLQLGILYGLFIPMAFLNIGLSFIVANAPSIVLNTISDKSNASAMLNFINMGMAALLISATQKAIPSLLNFSLLFLGILTVLLCASGFTVKTVQSIRPSTA